LVGWLDGGMGVLALQACIERVADGRVNDVPDAGEILVAMDSDKQVRELAQKRAEYLRQKELSKSTKVSLDELSALIAEGQIKSLPVIVKAEKLDTKLATVRLDSHHHLFSQGIDEGALLGMGRNNVVYGGEGARGIANVQAADTKLLKSLRARDFMEQVQADEKLGLPCGKLTNRVLLPGLL